MKKPSNEAVVRIGVYGRTQAGKTRFLYELLHHWEQDRRLLEQSPSCQEFLAKAGTQIDSYGGTKPTEPTSSQDGITVKVRQGDGEAPRSFTFRDLRGELLEEEIDDLESLTREGLIATQVTNCDAFLFFFDPTRWDSPTQITKHHERELKRAGMFIEYVLSKRQNDFLPIVFIATRYDEWGSNDQMASLARSWLNKTREKLLEHCEHYLKAHFPRVLVDPDFTLAEISALDTDSVEGVFENVVQLTGECVKFRRKDRIHMLRIGLSAVVFSIALAIGCVFFALQMSSPVTITGDDGSRAGIAVQTEERVNEILEEINQLLNAYPTNPTSVTSKDAKSLNEHLKWLVLSATTNVDERSKETLGGVTETLNRAATVISLQNERSDEESPQVLQLLETYLSGVSDASTVSTELGKSQQKYWEIKRVVVARELGRILNRRDQLESTPQKCLSDLIATLQSQKQQVTQANVAGPRGELLEAIRLALDFCEDRSSSKTYKATMRIVSAQFKSPNSVVPAPHAITIESNGVASRSFSLKPENINPQTPKILIFSTKEVSFDLECGLGRSILCLISKYNSSDRSWEEVERFELVEKDVGPFSALGMPFLRRNKSETTKVADPGGYLIKLEFSAFRTVPRLLWEAVE